jgi:hypothetical protein
MRWIIAAVLLASPAVADTCALPNVVTCSRPMSGTAGCNADPALYTCRRDDGTRYSVPAWSSEPLNPIPPTELRPKVHTDRLPSE